MTRPTTPHEPAWQVDLTSLLPSRRRRPGTAGLSAIATVTLLAAGPPEVMLHDQIVTGPQADADALTGAVADLTGRRAQLQAAASYADEVTAAVETVAALTAGQWPAGRLLTGILATVGPDVTVATIDVTTTEDLWAATSTGAGTITITGTATGPAAISDLTGQLDTVTTISHSRVVTLTATDDGTVTFTVTATLTPPGGAWHDGPPAPLLDAITDATVGHTDDIPLLDAPTYTDLPDPSGQGPIR